MDIKQRFTVRHPPAVVWDALADAPFSVQCLPGAELDESTDGRHYKGRMRVKLGPLAAAFSGDAMVDRNVADKTGTVEWTGVDSKSNSRAKARMVYTVLPESDGKATAVQIHADIVLTGALAQFGRSSIVNDVAARLTAIFAENLQNRLNATTAPSAVDGTPASSAGLAKEPFKSAELRPMDLLLSVLRTRMALRLRRWADRLDPNHSGSSGGT
jgi:carbon monoxide dehydrogenase subunit G